ncbi:MAG: DinB family protein [Bacteroidota bacterium]
MKRTHFLKNALSFGLLSMFGCQFENNRSKAVMPQAGKQFLEEQKSAKILRKELIVAWHRSEKMTLTNVEQMPPEFFTFKYTEEAMTFSEQWRHCVMYTCGQLASRSEIANPYENLKLPVQLTKSDVIKELKNMYSFVRQSLNWLSDEKLFSHCDFAGETIPIWRLFYAMENHIIHHRGQCVVYLRLNGVIPKGYYGW